MGAAHREADRAAVAVPEELVELERHGRAEAGEDRAVALVRYGWPPGSHGDAIPLDLVRDRFGGLGVASLRDEVQRNVDPPRHAGGRDDVAVVDHALAHPHVGAEAA